VLHLRETSDGPAVPVQPARSRRLVITAWQPPAGPAPGLDGLRTALLADLLRRVAQRHNLVPVVGLAGPGAADAAGTDWLALNIHPPADLPGPPDVQVGGTPPEARYWIACGPATVDGAADAPAVLAHAAERGLDPLALRLALLERPAAEPAELTWPGLADAGRLLDAWRVQVARWATHPSRPMPASLVAAITGPLDDALDSPAAVAGLRELADSDTDDTGDVPPGARFEAFAHVDQFVGLDLARQVGQL
jgi:hypothetical protein